MSRSPADAFATGVLLCGEDADATISGENLLTSSSSYVPSYSPPSDDAAIGGLINVEAHHMPDPDYLRRCRYLLIDVTARQDSINWILKVHAHYEFRPVTAFLSVNYLDRFLSCCSPPPQNNQWEYHLISVACLSLAAKMEEPEVPLLLDLQLADPRFVFEPETIQRMELCVLTKLHWRLRSVTPFDYLHYFISKLSCSSDPQPDSITRFISTASNIILSTTLVIDFLGFAPSTIAAAAVLCLAGQAPSPPFFHDGVNKEMVRSCHQLMEDYVVDTCPSAGNECPGAEPQPPSSPVGVLNAASSCVSCETRSENPAASTSEAEPPPNKRAQSPAPDGE